MFLCLYWIIKRQTANVGHKDGGQLNQDRLQDKNFTRWAVKASVHLYLSVCLISGDQFKV